MKAHSVLRKVVTVESSAAAAQLPTLNVGLGDSRRGGPSAQSRSAGV